MCGGVQEGRLTQQFMSELGLVVGLVLKTDSSAGKQAAEKVGSLKQEHMQLRYHFLKDLVRAGLVVMEKVATKFTLQTC